MDFMELEAALPPVIARSQIDRLFGGIIAGRTIANADSRGTGPGGKFYVGRRACYKTHDLLVWLSGKVSVAG